MAKDEEAKLRREPAQSGTKEPEFPQLTKLRAQDRQDHVQKALEMGLSREEAERHADEEVRERDDSKE